MADSVPVEILEQLDSHTRYITSKSFEILQSNEGLDYQSDISVDNSVLVVGDSILAMDFCKYLTDLARYNITNMPYIDSLSGYLGHFVATIDDKIINVSQVVFFTKMSFLDSDKSQLGVEFASNHDSKDSILSSLDSMIGDFTYENTILYTQSKCQYHHRTKSQSTYCHECADVCPTNAIIKDDAKRELILYDIDCILCGKCVSVCPSGAMQKANAPLECITKAARLYGDTIPLLVSLDDLQDISESTKNTNITPFILPNINMLNEVYLLSILQESGKPLIIYGKQEPMLEEAVNFINDLLFRIYHKQGIYSIDSSDFTDKMQDLVNLKNHLDYAFDVFHYDANSYEFTREIFANRITSMIKNNDYGTLPSTKYANLAVRDNCTLCMSCVEACNAKALISSKDNFELLLNPAFCTVCGYCEDICPEHAIEMNLSGMELKYDYFSYSTKAKDEPFACVECGKVFASAKSIAKVESIMLPLFGNDSLKKRTLRCCSDCKVKVMFKAI